MRVLALETSSLAGSVAACDNDAVISEFDLGAQHRTARSLAPAMQSILAQAGWTPQDVQLVAVAVGPGSFTGLRAGVTSAKVFAYACGADVIGVNTLAAIAAQARPPAEHVWAGIDAQRNQLFTAQFDTRTDGQLQVRTATRVVDHAEWLAQLDDQTTVTGTGLEPLLDQLPPAVVVSPADTWRPRAATIARLGLVQHQSGAHDDVWTLAPQYFRKSYAEEKS